MPRNSTPSQESLKNQPSSILMRRGIPKQNAPSQDVVYTIPVSLYDEMEALRRSYCLMQEMMKNDLLDPERQLDPRLDCLVVDTLIGGLNDRFDKLVKRTEIF